MRLAVLAVCIAAASAVTFLLTDPTRYATESQKALLEAYLKFYCKGPRPAAEIGIPQMALLSRLVIKAGLGPLAMAESIKCLELSTKPASR